MTRTARRRRGLLVLLALAPLLVAAARAGWPRAPAAGPVWPPPPDPARMRYVTTIAAPGDIGAGPSWLSRVASTIVGRRRQPRVLRPHGMATDSAGRLIVADPEQQMVHVFDLGRKRYGHLDSAPFGSPVGVAVGADDAIYVTDSARRRVFAYTREGKLRGELGGVGGENPFVRPTGIAARDGRLYVVDTVAAAVAVLDTSGRELTRFGRRGAAPGEFNYPTDIAIGGDGHVYVLDALNARVQEFDAAGGFLRQFGQRGSGTGLFDRPKGIGIDSDGHLYVAEGLHDVLQVFDRQGRLMLVVGASGTGAGEFALPSAVHVDRADRVYVADAQNGRVQVFQYIKRAEVP